MMTSAADQFAVAAMNFATRARTIDHLGREQIADCPTAVSELWKNAWDAYARNVRLRIFSEDVPVALLTDDGHGMRAIDLFQRWLVIGTESKVSDYEPLPVNDRNGLAVRPRQGQKGIGRLSSAKLGSLLLLISKHREDDFVVAFIDWRMFENPYINLSDVVVATSTFKAKNDVFAALPSLVETLVYGIIDAKSDWRKKDQPIKVGWKRYDDAWLRENPAATTLPPSQRILQSLKNLPFRTEHLDDWEGPGTAMLVCDLDDTLKALPVKGDTDLVRDEVAERFERTLSNFVDPYTGDARPQFSYRADIRHSDLGGLHTKVIVGVEKAIDRTQVKEMEHQIEGVVGLDGVFRGKIKAFGSYLDGAVEFKLPKGLTMPDRAGARVGPFSIYIASMEFELRNSTHPQSEHGRYIDLAKDYSGLMIYRDELRVLPYGREDNDFFSIEYKRSKNAGRYFWNHRQMFGRIALTREHNPNLKDKAGREGFIDNTAAKTFRAIVGNILDESARRYFGSASEIRKPKLTENQEKHRAGRAEEEAKKLRERERKQFQLGLELAENNIPALQQEINREVDTLAITRDLDVSDTASRISRWRTALADVQLPYQPIGTARLAPRYQTVKAQAAQVADAIVLYEKNFRDALNAYSATAPDQILQKQVKDSSLAIRKQAEDYQQKIVTLQREQYEVVRNLVGKRVSDFEAEAEVIRIGLVSKQFALDELVVALNRLRDTWITENRNIFGIYLSALEAVKETIDLETLASVQVQDLREAAAELDRLTALAQLGIAVEIAAHDLADFDEMATTGLNTLPADIQGTRAVKDIRLGLEGLTDQLRFLSPLRLSGDKVQRWITGAEIQDFVTAFFAPTLTRAAIDFKGTAEFKSLRLYERPARVFPVFINLINNSIYWVGTMPRSARQIILDFIGEDVVISDSGPGVASEDINQIFKLFFTRKQRSGRGVGLYLARANLAAGGHSIRYKEDTDTPPLNGASFYIRFKDAQISTSDI